MDGFQDSKFQVIMDFEKEYLRELLLKTKGNVFHAAKIAKLDRSNFYRLLRKWNVDPKLFRLGNSLRASSSLSIQSAGYL